MYPFLETIRIENGSVPYLDWHQRRMALTLRYFFPTAKAIKLQELLSRIDIPIEGRHKLRLLYGPLGLDHTLQPYKPKQYKTVQLVEVNQFYQYPFKFSDRTLLDQLKNKGDEIIIIREGQILDSSIANVIFRKNDQWYTPKSYLLNGTTRQRLLSNGFIVEKEITYKDICDYDAISFVNAMIEPGEIVMPIDSQTIKGL